MTIGISTCLSNTRKPAPDDILIQISVCNRGAEAAALHVLPTLWFRNTWTWWPEQPKPSLRRMHRGKTLSRSPRSHAELGELFPALRGNPALLFTENETNNERLFGTANATPYVKDGINDYVVAGRQDAVNPNQTGTKAAAHYRARRRRRGRPPSIRLRLSNAALLTIRSAASSRKSSSSAGARPTSSIERSRLPASATMRPM